LIEEHKETVLTGQTTLAAQGNEISKHFFKELNVLKEFLNLIFNLLVL